jgi:hypothetical protein
MWIVHQQLGESGGCRDRMCHSCGGMIGLLEAMMLLNTATPLVYLFPERRDR